MIAVPLGARSRGFTLVELIAVMVVIGIVAAVGGVGISRGLENYRFAQQRAELMEMADTALRRVGRDIRLALPTSVRKSATDPNLVEFLLTKNGGRYTSGAAAASLWAGVSGGADNYFETVGPLTVGPNQSIAVGDVVVVNHDPVDVALSNDKNAYTYGSTQVYCTVATDVRCNTSNVAAPLGVPTGVTTPINIDSRYFPTEHTDIRTFYVLPNKPAVTYACLPATDADGNGTGTLVRYYNYDVKRPQPTTFAGANSAIVAQYVSACSMTVGSGGVADIMYLELTLKRNGGTVTLFHQVWLQNG